MATSEKELAAALTEFFARPYRDEAFGLAAFPTLTLFAATRGMDEKRLRRLAARGGIFGKTLAAGEARVRELRIAAAEAGRCNATFEKYVLAALYGMTEEKGADATGEPLTVEIKVTE